MNVPKLRFKDENKADYPNWQFANFGEVFTFKSTNSYSRECLNYEIGTTKNIHYGDIHTKFKTLFDITSENVPFVNTDIPLDKVNDEAFCCVGDLVIADASEDYKDIGKSIEIVNLDNQSIIAGLHTFLARPATGLLSIGFMGYAMQSSAVRLQVMTIAQGTKVLSISTGRLAKVQIPLPEKEEQQKIADFLSAVDEKITALTAQKTALTQYKQGMMQRIFSQTLRFKDNNGVDYPDWEEMRLGDLLDYEQPTKYLVSSTDYQNDYPTPVLTAGKTFILGYTDEQDGIFTNLPVIIFDDFTTANKFVNFPFKAKSSAMKMLKNDPTKSNLRFIYETMQLLDFATGDEHKRYWISEYQEQFIFMPCLKEQTKIAQFLTELDDKINAVDAQIQSAQQWKQGLLQQMFV